MRFFIATLLLCTSLHASQDVADSKQSISTAITAAKTAVGVAKAAIISSCVTPQATTECNSTASTVVTIAGDVLSTLTSSAIKGVAGPIAGGVISAASCLAIRCDSSTTQKTTCSTNCFNYCCDTYPTETPPQAIANGTNYGICDTECTTSTSKDSGTYNNNYPGVGEYYPGCVSESKGLAQKQQTKCQSICAGMVLALATLETVVTGIAPDVDKIENQISTKGGNTNSNANTNNNRRLNNNTNNNISDDADLGYEKKRLAGISNTNGNNSLATTGGLGTGTAGSATGIASGASSTGGASSGGDRDRGSSEGANALVAGSEATAVVAGTSNEASSSASSDSNGINNKTKLKGLGKSNTSGEYLASSRDLFGQVSEIHTFYYRAGTIGINTSSNVSNKKVRR